MIGGHGLHLAHSDDRETTYVGTYVLWLPLRRVFWSSRTVAPVVPDAGFWWRCRAFSDDYSWPTTLPPSDRCCVSLGGGSEVASGVMGQQRRWRSVTPGICVGNGLAVIDDAAARESLDYVWPRFRALWSA